MTHLSRVLVLDPIAWLVISMALYNHMGLGHLTFTARLDAEGKCSDLCE